MAKYDNNEFVVNNRKTFVETLLITNSMKIYSVLKGSAGST